MPLAPAAQVAARFPERLALLLDAYGADPAFIARELAAMADVTFAKTASRSILGSMNDFTWVAGHDGFYDPAELHWTSIRLAKTPIGPMKYKSPADMLEEVFENWENSTDEKPYDEQ